MCSSDLDSAGPPRSLPPPPPKAPSGAGGAERQGEGSAIGPRPQLHTKPFTFSLPPKLLPGLRFSEGLGCPLRWSAGRSDCLSKRCLLPRVSASSSPPLATDPEETSVRAWGPPGTPPCARGPGVPEPLRPRGADSGTSSPSRSATRSRAHTPSPQRSGRVPISPILRRRGSPAAATLLPARRRARQGASAPRAPARAPRRGASALVLLLRRRLQRPRAGWRTGWSPGWLLAGASCRAGQRTFPGRSRGMFPACLDL